MGVDRIVYAGTKLSDRTVCAQPATDQRNYRDVRLPDAAPPVGLCGSGRARRRA
jgi:hypothetical protein